MADEARAAPRVARNVLGSSTHHGGGEGGGDGGGEGGGDGGGGDGGGGEGAGGGGDGNAVGALPVMMANCVDG